MKKIFRPVILVIGLFGAVIAAWRIVSRLRPMPSPPWMAWLLEGPMARGMQADLLVKRARLAPGMRVLDAGCGAGRVTIPLASAVGSEGEVIAMDIQPAMLEIARQRAKAAQLTNIRFMLTGFGEEMLPEYRFDRALLTAVLGEIPNPEQALHEIAVSLKQDGILSVSEFYPDPHFLSQCDVRRLAQMAGLMEVEIFGNAVVYTINFRKPQPGI